MSVLDSIVLVLNKNWQPVSTKRVKDALVDIYSGDAFAINHHDYTIHTMDSWYNVNIELPEINIVDRPIKIPEIIMLDTKDIANNKKASYSRTNVLIRDKFKCAYCGYNMRSNEATVDHVIPRSKGGKTVWKNLVACCKACNVSKSDNMNHPFFALNKEPHIPSVIELMRNTMQMSKTAPNSWKMFIK